MTKMKPQFTFGIDAETRPRARAFIETGTLKADTVSGKAKFGMNSAGFWWFTGNVREHAAFFGHDWTFTFLLKFQDSSGNSPAWKDDGTLCAKVQPRGPSADD